MRRDPVERRLTAVRWTAGGILLAEFVADPAGVLQCGDPVAIPFPGDEEFASQAELDNWLLQQLEAIGLTADEVAVSVGGHEIVVQHFALPPAPESELDAMVRMQLANSVPAAGDDLVWRNEVGPLAPGGRAVTAIAARRCRVESIEQLFGRLGKRVVFVSSPAVAIAELAQHLATSEEDLLFVVAWLGSELHAVVQQSGKLIFSSSAAVPPGADLDWVVRNTLRAGIAGAQRTDRPLGQVRVLADPARRQAFVDRLAAALEVVPSPLEVSQIPRLSRVENLSTEQLELAAAALAAVRDNPTRLNLISHSESAWRPAHRQLAIGIAAAVLAVICCGWWFSRWQARSARMTELQAELEMLDERLASVQASTASAAEISEWMTEREDWLKPLQQLSATLRGRELYLDRLALVAGEVTTAGRTRAAGRARSEADVRQFFQGLVDQHEFRIKSRPVEYAAEDAEFPVRFFLDSDLGGHDK